ncbi:MAG: PAS domain S-box protein [Planctomycetota bacterium]|nr:PAS domain S-box protein [Planctomycetota bacterium]
MTDSMHSSSNPFDRLHNQLTADESLKVVLNTIVDGVIIADERGVIFSANPAAEKMFGFASHDLIGTNISRLMPSPHRDQHDRYLNEYLAGGQARIIGIGRRVEGLKSDGTLVPIDLSISEVHLGDERIFIGVLRDMTERQRAEEKFQREHAFLESLFETAHAIILVLDTAGKIVRFNGFMEEISGYTLDDVCGNDWFTTFLPLREQERVRSVFHHCLTGQPVQGNINPIVTRTGQERIIAWSARVLKDSAGDMTGVLSIGNDITELHNAEQRLLQSERLAAIGQMMAGLAHESRNSLQRAHACLEMLSLDLDDRPQQRDLTQRTQRALDELQRLYDEVRNYAAPLKLERRECRLSELLKETWEHVQDHTDGKPFEFRIHCDPKVVCCHVDWLRMQQVFRNIFDNSVFACLQNPHAIHGEIDVDVSSVAYQGKPGVSLCIRDNGTGMKPDQIKGIFEPFFTSKTKGTGLGMPIAKRIVEAHGGEIFVGNTIRTGTEINILLPREPA